MRCCSAKWVGLASAVLLAFCCGKTNAELQVGEGVQWQKLFDGRTLDGWEVKGGHAKYHVEDGAIVGTTVAGSPNTFLCTKKPYGDFILEFEVKDDPVLNSGVQIRSDVYEKDTELGVWRRGSMRKVVRKAGHVYGYQVEISSERSGSSGGIWDEARKAMWLYSVSEDPAARGAFKDNQWNKFRIVCFGDWIRTWINEVPCTDLLDPTDQVGFIGLQVHSFRGDKPAQVRWRNIRIKDLGKHVWKPLFNGESLDGWHTIPGGKWQVGNGIINGSNVSSDGRHGLLVSDKPYKDFTVKLDFKALQGNSGLYFRVEEVAGAVGVHGFQAEIDESKDVGGAVRNRRQRLGGSAQQWGRRDMVRATKVESDGGLGPRAQNRRARKRAKVGRVEERPGSA